MKTVLSGAFLSLLIATGAQAATIGSAVVGNGSTVEVTGQPGPANQSDIDGINATVALAAGTGATSSDVIGYYIPLADSGSCTFGVDCGLAADTGSGGQTMDMWLHFASVDGGFSVLNLFFEDLDLMSANDPAGFFEAVDVFDTAGTLIAGFSNINDIGASGSASEQQILNMDLGFLTANTDYWTRLTFSASYTGIGQNTPEFLLAVVDADPDVQPPEVPLPAAGWLLLTAIGAGAAVGRKKRG